LGSLLLPYISVGQQNLGVKRHLVAEMCTLQTDKPTESSCPIESDSCMAFSEGIMLHVFDILLECLNSNFYFDVRISTMGFYVSLSIFLKLSQTHFISILRTEREIIYSKSSSQKTYFSN
jgi:hypothetical protein